METAAVLLIAAVAALAIVAILRRRSGSNAATVAGTNEEIYLKIKEALMNSSEFRWLAEGSNMNHGIIQLSTFSSHSPYINTYYVRLTLRIDGLYLESRSDIIDGKVRSIIGPLASRAHLSIIQ